MAIGFDTSPLTHPHSPGVRRVTEELVEALERRGHLEIVRLTPDPGERLRTWRQLGLPREAARLGLAGIHSPVSAFPLFGPGRRVQTVHELPWKHGVAENAGLSHRFWAGPAGRKADAVIVPTGHVARDLGRPLAADGGRIHICSWAASLPMALSADPIRRMEIRNPYTSSKTWPRRSATDARERRCSGLPCCIWAALNAVGWVLSIDGCNTNRFRRRARRARSNCSRHGRPRAPSRHTQSTGSGSARAVR